MALTRKQKSCSSNCSRFTVQTVDTTFYYNPWVLVTPLSSCKCSPWHYSSTVRAWSSKQVPSAKHGRWRRYHWFWWWSGWDFRTLVSFGLLPTLVSSFWEAWSTAVLIQQAFGEHSIVTCKMWLCYAICNYIIEWVACAKLGAWL